MKKSMLILATLTATLLVFSFNKQNPTGAAEDLDITTLIKTAKTPKDHFNIAEYYDEQAVIMDKKATLHESMAEAYKGTKMTGMTFHCERLARESSASAEQYRALAAEHRKMAQETKSQDSQQPL